MKPMCLALALLSWLGGCASDVPVSIREPLIDSPTLAQVQSDPKGFAGRQVRWGGTIVSTKTEASQAEIEILAKALGEGGRPEGGDVSAGRFLIRAAGFFDPALYRADRQLSVYGVLENTLVRKIGEHAYTYPVVTAIQLHLWPEPSEEGGWYPGFHIGIGVGGGF